MFLCTYSDFLRNSSKYFGLKQYQENNQKCADDGADVSEIKHRKCVAAKIKPQKINNMLQRESVHKISECSCGYKRKEDARNFLPMPAATSVNSIIMLPRISDTIDRTYIPSSCQPES